MNDLIKRQDAITAYCEHECGIKGMTRENCGATDCGTIFDDIPSAQQWIPCSERLPEEFYVLCCDNHGEMLIANPFECDDSDTGFSAESEDCYMYNCVAWMPLPEPYKGEES